MSDKPILFSAPMVRAILEGRKTQTRRVLPFQPKWRGRSDHNSLNLACLISKHGPTIYAAGEREMAEKIIDCSHPKRSQLVRYDVGERLWVRETCITWIEEPQTVEFPVLYYEDKDWEAVKKEARRPNPEWKLRPSIHMPRWASRITLIVTDVRVQRLQEISREDAIAEGLTHRKGQIEPDWWVLPEPLHQGTWLSPVAAFRFLWDSLNAKRGYGWDVNPWVVAITFQPVFKNIDEVTHE